jgi:hypothetical protein
MCTLGHRQLRRPRHDLGLLPRPPSWWSTAGSARARGPTPGTAPISSSVGGGWDETRVPCSGAGRCTLSVEHEGSGGGGSDSGASGFRPQAGTAPSAYVPVPDPGPPPTPRLSCPTHGVRQFRVPWAEERARFTAFFEALAIDWMQHAAIATVAEPLRLSWDEAAGIQARTVQRGLARRPAAPAHRLGIDETAFYIPSTPAHLPDAGTKKLDWLRHPARFTQAAAPPRTDALACGSGREPAAQAPDESAASAHRPYCVSRATGGLGLRVPADHRRSTG